MIGKIFITFLIFKCYESSVFEILSNDIQLEDNLIEKFQSSNRIQCIFKCIKINDCRFSKYSKNVCYLYSPYGRLDFINSNSIRIHQQLRFMRYSIEIKIF